MSFSDILIYLRTQKGLTQKELAKQLGCALSVIGDIESGRRPPSKNMAIKLAYFFNTPVELWLINQENMEACLQMNGDILKKLRLNHNLTQKELAEKIGVAHNTIAMIETGKRQGDRDTINKLADYFNVSIDYLEGRHNMNTGSISLIDNYLDMLIDNGLINDPYNIDDTILDIILNVIKAQIYIKFMLKKISNLYLFYFVDYMSYIYYNYIMLYDII